MELKVNLESIRFNPEGVSQGIIYFKLNDFNFPDPVWNDFLEVILNWWINDLCDYLETKDLESNFEMEFMDGPCLLYIEFLNDFDTLSVLFVRNNIPQADIIISVKSFVKELRTAVNSILRLYNERGWENEDYKKLVKSFSRLQKVNL